MVLDKALQQQASGLALWGLCGDSVLNDMQDNQVCAPQPCELNGTVEGTVTRWREVRRQEKFFWEDRCAWLACHSASP